MGERKVAHRILAEKPEGRGPLGETRRRLEDHIKINLR
jgi:hypothetical protein